MSWDIFSFDDQIGAAAGQLQLMLGTLAILRSVSVGIPLSSFELQQAALDLTRNGARPIDHELWDDTQSSRMEDHNRQSIQIGLAKDLCHAADGLATVTKYSNGSGDEKNFLLRLMGLICP